MDDVVVIGLVVEHEGSATTAGGCDPAGWSYNRGTA